MTLATTQKLTLRTFYANKWTKADRKLFAKTFFDFIDIASTATGRATFYNTQAEQRKMILDAHEIMFLFDRGIYSLSLTLPGMTDYSRQLGLILLLKYPRLTGEVLTDTQEKQVIHHLMNKLPIQRRLKLFESLVTFRINNARTRKLILRSILNSSKLEWWAVKYRRKIATALEHAWGKRQTSIIRSILAKDHVWRSTKETSILKKYINKHITTSGDWSKRMECISFILGNQSDFKQPLLKSYVAARTDLKAGSRLPFEVLEGIRSRFHPDVSSEETLKLTKKTLTTGQRMNLQRKAEKSNTEVAFDPTKYDAVRLYIYAYEMGITEAIKTALHQKAIQAAKELPIRFEKIAILVDNSLSMTGHDTQAMRPMAIACATRDVLQAAADVAHIQYTSPTTATSLLTTPIGGTSLAEGLVALLETQPEAIFVLTDGYENSPAGRFNEVMHLVRKMGIETPVFQLNPVTASEAEGSRRLSDLVQVMPIQKMEALNIGLLKAIFEVDLEKGFSILLSKARDLIGG